MFRTELLNQIVLSTSNMFQKERKDNNNKIKKKGKKFNNKEKIPNILSYKKNR